jgi:transposase
MSKPTYPAKYRERLVDLVRSGRSPEKLAEEFEPCAAAIRSWVKQADLDDGRRKDGLTTEERGEIQRLRRENRQLREERDILKKAAAWFAKEADGASSKRSGS